MTFGKDVIGHAWPLQQLRNLLETRALPHALLISGPERVGKETLARLLVKTLFCTASDARPCGACPPCRKVESGNYPDFLVVSPLEEGGALKIEQIRALERFLSLTPHESERKVALVTDFERATVSAANALLKTLEEPPPYAHLFLLASDTDLLLPTIVSRSQQINLRPVPAQIIAQALTDRWRVAPDAAERLARLSGGRVGWAVRAATEPDYLQKMEVALQTLFDLLGQDLPSRFATAQALAQNAAALPETFEYWLIAWRDVLFIHAGVAERIVYREQRADLESVAARTSLESCAGILRTLEAAQIALAQNANTQLLVENLLLNLPA